MQKRSRWEGFITRLSLVLVVTFLVSLTALHFLEPEFNPPHLISEYELGHFGWLMSIAFFCLGAGSLCLAVGIWSYLQTKGGIIARWWLVLVGIAYISAGIFTPDPKSTGESLLHGISGIIVIFSSPFVFTLLRRSLSFSDQRFKVSSLTKWTTIFTWVGLLSFYGSILVVYGVTGGANSTVVGWTNRFMIITYSSWLLTTGWQIIKFHY